VDDHLNVERVMQLAGAVAHGTARARLNDQHRRFTAAKSLSA
jgi:hypothetical protein